jgi:hypothetical protein
MLKNLSLTQEEEMLKQKFAQLQKFRQDTTKPDQRDLKMKLTLKGSSKASSGRVGSIANAKAILNQEREQKELKKESGFKRSARVNTNVNTLYYDNSSPEKKRNFEFDNNNDDPRQPSMDYQENAKRAKTDDYNDYNNNNNDNNNNNNNNDSDNVICITELPDSCTEENLRRRFEMFGEIKEFKPQFQEYAEKYALIHYYSSSHADEAVAEFERDPIFEGKEIQVYKPNLDENDY